MSSARFSVGDLVKVRLLIDPPIQGAVSERIWVRVERIADDGVCVGTLDNRPVVIEADSGSRVGFTIDQVIDVWRDQ